jgi:signal transduction histidine kinase
MRLAVVFALVFLVSGAALLALTVAVWQGRTGVNVTAVPVPAGANPASGLSQHTSDRHQLLVSSETALAIMAVASLAVGWLVAGRFLRPLRTIMVAARKISATNLHERLNLTGADDELKELADTFDALLDRLERSFSFERQFAANASHELRTPLAGMRASLDVAMAKPDPVPVHIHTLAERLRRELDHIDRLLENFLALAHTQQGPFADKSTVSLTELARLAIEQRSDAIAAARLELEQQHLTAWVSGSETLLTRMVENLIANAINHNQPEGWLRVTTAVEETRAYLVVENGGPLLDPDEVRQLTQPFRRVGAERTGSDQGTGLGLAIVSSIVDAHGGTLELEARGAGGLRVTIALPRASAAAGASG